MREDFWEFPPTHKFWLAANAKPIVKGTDHAIWRRIKTIPFTRQFGINGNSSMSSSLSCQGFSHGLSQVVRRGMRKG